MIKKLRTGETTGLVMLAVGDQETFLSDLKVVDYTKHGAPVWSWKIPGSAYVHHGAWEDISRDENVWADYSS